jgi:hypothetical protein
MVIAARVIFGVYVALICWCVYRAASGKPRLYWVAAFLTYVMSLLFAWSIGGYTVALTFALVGAGCAHLLGRAAPRDVIAGATAGTIVWALWLTLGDITWAFAPAMIF